MRYPRSRRLPRRAARRAWQKMTMAESRMAALIDRAGERNMALIPCHRRLHVLHWMLFLVLLVACWNPVSCEEGHAAIATSSDSTVPEAIDTTKDTPSVTTGSGPIVLNARNFSSSIGDGNVWLVEFYATWCTHCLAFAPTYSDLAREIHADSTLSIKVAKVDGADEQALVSRFDIHAFPSFFVVDGWSVYEFDEPRNKKNLLKFVKGGYKEKNPLPFYMSPMGPLGLMQGFFTMSAITFSDNFEVFRAYFGFSQLVAAAVLFFSTFLGSFVLIVTVAILSTPKVKID